MHFEGERSHTMNYHRNFAAVCAAAACLGLAILPAHADSAAKWTGGQSATISGSLFQVSGGVVTVSLPGTPVFLNVNNGDSERLLGISGLWVVNSSGQTLPGVASVTGGGTVSGNGTSQWTAQSGPAGYAAGPGFSPNNDWISLADASTLASYGKTPSDYTQGAFTFSGLSGVSGCDFGVDYLISNGRGATQTGRAFFGAPSITPAGPPINVAAVPEPGTMSTFALAASGLVGCITARRRRRSL